MSGWLTPLTTALRLAPRVVGSAPKSTFARTPIVQLAAEETKYGSVQSPLKSVTPRASGGSCAPTVPAVQPRA